MDDLTPSQEDALDKKFMCPERGEKWNMDDLEDWLKAYPSWITDAFVLCAFGMEGDLPHPSAIAEEQLYD